MIKITFLVKKDDLIFSKKNSCIPFFEKNNQIIFKDANNIFFTSIKSGDLLFISYKNLIKLNFVKLMCRSIWTHVSIFYKDPITLEAFVLEAASYHPPYNSQFIRIPFNLWLKINRNQKICVMPINKEIDTKKLLKTRESLKYKGVNNYTVEDFNWRWIKFLFNKKKKSIFTRKSTSITCVEYVIKIYKRMGIIKPKYHSSSYFTSCLMNLRDIEMRDGYEFKKKYLLEGFQNNNKIPF